MLIDEVKYLEHYGTPRRSGRYPWGSGKSENQHNKTFVQYVADMRKEGLTNAQIAEGLGMTTNDFLAENTIAKNQQKAANIAMAERLADKGMSTNAIAKRMQQPESTVRTWLAPGAKDKTSLLEATSSMLKKEVDAKRYLDVGAGVENLIGVSSNNLKIALSMLKQMGYLVHPVKHPQLTTQNETNMKVLVPPGVTQREVFLNKDKIQQIKNFSDDHGRTFFGIHPPIAVNPRRVSVVYAENGGAKADGVMYVRPGKKDISLGPNNYAQVRVKVGDSHYLKGMALYKDDLPAGTDIQFHTSKSKTEVKNKLDALKKLTDDPENPFGSIVRQLVDNPGMPSEKPYSAMNIVNPEGKWDTWSRTLSSQMLSKQQPKLAKEQLDMTFEMRKQEYENILAITNPVVKKKLLEDFAESTDTASVNLKAAALPRQAQKVILPINSIPPTHVYAPSFRDGERVVLIRHPHGGTFEIPELVVDNSNREAIKVLGKDPRDAIGIHHTVAERLSGADFDGDSVLVIPNNSGRVTKSPPLEDLKNFDPRVQYKGHDGMKVMSDTQKQMGEISNLISDMSLQNASTHELARAVKHSMVVIDAEKHGLNYKQSATDNNIKELKQKYQTGGASTLISRAKSREMVPGRKPRPASEGGPINTKTGAKEFVPTNQKNWRTGKPVLTKSTKLAEAKDAHALSSGTPMERLYADHSNKLKDLANQARLQSIKKVPKASPSPSAKSAYKDQVAHLEEGLDRANKNKPLERQAQIIGTTTYKMRVDHNPNMTKDQKKKARYQSLEVARQRTKAAQKSLIEIDQPTWDAIQAGAISNTKLTEVLKYADMDAVRKLATPKDQVLMTSSKTNRAKSMLDMGYTRQEVADALGVSMSTLDTATS